MSLINITTQPFFIFLIGTPPPFPLPLSSSVYLGRQNVIHVIKWTRPSPSIFAYCKLNYYEDKDHSVSMYLTELEARSNLFFMFTRYNFTAKSSFSKVFGYNTAVCDYDVIVVI